MENVNFDEFRGDVEGIKALIHGIETMTWFDGHDELPAECLLFKTREEARDAALAAALVATLAADTGGIVALDAAYDEARDAAWNAAWVAARNAAWVAAFNGAHDAARNAAWVAAFNVVYNAARNAAWIAASDAALYAVVLTCDGLSLAQKHIDYAKRRWEVWKAGYGVECDVMDENGVVTVYCYKRV